MSALALLGVALLVALLADVALTVFAPDARHGGPIHRRQNSLTWGLFRILGTRRDGSTRPGILALAGPTGALLTLSLWSGWLVLGFALIYKSSNGSFTSAGTAMTMTWVEAIYYSGYVATTLGIGDVVATTKWLRLITILEALTGFGLFAVATSYVLAISRELTNTSALALEVATLRGARAFESEQVGGGAARSRWAEGWARSLLRITDAHGRYPLLHFFRPDDDDRSLVVQLAWLMRLVGVHGGEGDPDVTPLPPHAKEFLERAIARYLTELNHACVPRGFRPIPPGEASLEHLYARLLRYLCYDAGVWEVRS